MLRAALISLATLAASAAQACVIPPPVCQVSPGVSAALDGQNGSVILFYEDYDNGQERYVVTECNSRQSLAVTDPTDYDSRFIEAINVISDAVWDDRPQTLAEVGADVRAASGLQAELFTLPSNHCGCSLPQQPPPIFECPVFE